MSDVQIDHVLQMQTVGRLGIVNGKVPHIVPIAYVYDGRYVYAHSQEGHKIDLMRREPSVCFQVDDIESLDRWRSVILYGRFQELTNERDIDRASKLINARFEPMMSNDVTRLPLAGTDPPRQVHKARHAIYFRIRISQKSGRYEK